MNPMVKTGLITVLIALFAAGCSGTPEVQNDPYNEADSQRSRAKQAQDELSSEVPEER